MLNFSLDNKRNKRLFPRQNYDDKMAVKQFPSTAFLQGYLIAVQNVSRFPLTNILNLLLSYRLKYR